MTKELPRLPQLEAEQVPLGGLEESLMASPVVTRHQWLTVPEALGFGDPPEPDIEAGFTGPGAGQMSLESNQQVLRELEPVPQQLALLPDPAPWEADPEPRGGPAASSRLSRRRTKRGISPGQTSLF